MENEIYQVHKPKVYIKLFELVNLVFFYNQGFYYEKCSEKTTIRGSDDSDNSY